MSNPTTEIYTDGAFSFKKKRAGIGIYIKQGKSEYIISHAVPCITNNIAELLAIAIALSKTPDKQASINLYTDSKYCKGVLYEGWTPSKNIPTISYIRSLMKNFPRLRFYHVKGHAGHMGNEIADSLASYASQSITFQTMQQSLKKRFNKNIISGNNCLYFS